MRVPIILGTVTAIFTVASSAAIAQSTGSSPADPQNERNQRMAPSNTQPSDPAADRDPAARVPTSPVDRDAADREEGGATGTSSGESGYDSPAELPNTPTDPAP
jgi:hypothetical protein